MRLPKITASSGQLVELAWFVICALHADEDETGPQAGGIVHARAELKARMAHRNQAADDLIAARALRRVARQRVARWLTQLGLDANAAFGGQKKKKKSLAYQLLLPMAPSLMMAQGSVARMESLAKVLKGLAHADTPAVLKAQADKGTHLIKALAEQEAHVLAAQSVIADRVHEISVARKQWFTAYKSLEASLTLKFPDDADRVSSYFDTPPSPQAKAPVDVAQVDPANEKA
jgi:hypothetical protein